MRETVFAVRTVRPLTADTWELTLSGDTSAITAPGQFVNIALPGKFLRRPISVCDWTEGRLTLLVKAVGGGTEALVRAAPGTELNVLCGLGNGFDAARGEKGAALAGGGIGAAPLYGLARRMAAAGQEPTVALGFRSKEDALYVEAFRELGCEVSVATEDGTLGTKGFVTDVLKGLPGCRYVFACGPTPMLKAVWAMPQIKGGQFSLEARMGCGFGACVGCTIQTKNGPRRVCKDGPVFRKEELAWQTCG